MKRSFFIIVVCLIFISVSAFKLQTVKDLSQGLFQTPRTTSNLSQPFQLKATPSKTHLLYVGMDYFSKIDHLNRTLESFNRGYIYSAQSNDSSLTFSIYQAQPKFTYSQQKQIAEMVGSDIVVVEGQFADVQLQFDFTIIQGSKILSFGTGLAQATIDDLIYAIKLNLNSQQFIEIDLLDYSRPYLSSFKLTNISSSISDDHKAKIVNLLNNETSSIMKSIQKDLNTKFKSELEKAIISPQPFFQSQTIYQWKPFWSKKSINYTLTKKPLFFDIQKTGILMGYTYGNGTSQIIPPMSITSRLQQFTPYSFYKDFIMDSIQKGAFDNVLDRDLWSSPDFRFYAKDLTLIFTNIESRFKASEQVKISCSVVKNLNRVSVENGNSNSSFKVEMDWQCTVNVSQTKITELNVTLTLKIQGIAESSSIDFWVSGFKHKCSYNDSFGFRLKDEQRMNYVMIKVISNIQSSRIIGSGFPLEVPYKNPKMITNTNGTIVIDQDLSN